MKGLVSAKNLRFLRQDTGHARNVMFFDKKDLISGTGQIFAIVVFAVIWYTPADVIKRMVSMEINFKTFIPNYFRKFTLNKIQLNWLLVLVS